MPSSRGSSRPRDWTCVSYVSCRQVLLPWAPPGKPLCSSKLKQSELGQVRPRRLCGREDGSPGPVGQPGCWRGACLFYRRVRGERWKPEATGGLRSQTWEKVDRASCRDDKERHKQRLGRQSGSQGGRRNGTGSQVQAKWRLTGGELNLPGLDTQLGLSFTSTRPDNICIMSTCWLDKAKPPAPPGGRLEAYTGVGGAGRLYVHPSGESSGGGGHLMLHLAESSPTMVPVGRAYSELEQYEFSSEQSKLPSYVALNLWNWAGQININLKKKKEQNMCMVLGPTVCITKLQSCFTVERTGPVWSLPPGSCLTMDQGHREPTATWESLSVAVQSLSASLGTRYLSVFWGLGRQVWWFTFLWLSLSHDTITKTHNKSLTNTCCWGRVN